jgi:large subunit ribosomal protein L21
MIFLVFPYKNNIFQNHEKSNPAVDINRLFPYTILVTIDSIFMLAIIKTGGKQYKVKAGDRIKIEKLEGKAGEKIVFSEVLFSGDEKNVKIGNPLIKEAKVEGKILKTAKEKKVVGIKFKAKKRYKVKFGHRQTMTEVEIIEITNP